MAKEYLMKLNYDCPGNEVFINPLAVQVITDKPLAFLSNREGGFVGTKVIIDGQVIDITDTVDEAVKEYTRALNAMFSELGQQLKDASIYDIQHRR